MSGLQSILVATDLSGFSRHAADRATRLAQTSGARLTLAHVLGAGALDDLLNLSGDGEQVRAAIEADARERLQALAGQLEARHASSVAPHLGAGRPVHELTRLADEFAADLVVTGTRGTGFLRGVVIGSTAERLATRSARPVLLVRQTAHEPYRRVLVPIDFSAASRTSIELALRVASGAELILLHAIQIPFESRLRSAGASESQLARYRDTAITDARQRLGELAAATGLDPGSFSILTPEGSDPWMAIVRQELELDCDLIVMGKQGRHTLGDLLLGSTTRMVIAESSADVLVCAAPA
jgi:nucleotide-binding universal stress UspA family protein